MGNDKLMKQATLAAIASLALVAEASQSRQALMR